MLAAAATLWMLFSVWLICPYVGVPPHLSRIVGAALAAELVMLLAHSYGTEACDADACAPLAQAAGKQLRVVCAGGPVRRLLEMTNLTNRFSLCPSREEALASASA